VALAVSTVRVARGGSAPELRPWIVRYQGQYSGMARRSDAEFSAAYAPASPRAVAQDEPASRNEDVRLKKARSRGFRSDCRRFQVVFRVPGRIAVPAGQGSKSFRVASATIAPN